MKIINFADERSLVNVFMRELRDEKIQKDMLRFRRNIERIGEIAAYEISKTLEFKTIDTKTCLGTAKPCGGRNCGYRHHPARRTAFASGRAQLFRRR